MIPFPVYIARNAHKYLTFDIVTDGSIEAERVRTAILSSLHDVGHRYLSRKLYEIYDAMTTINNEKYEVLAVYYPLQSVSRNEALLPVSPARVFSRQGLCLYVVRPLVVMRTTIDEAKEYADKHRLSVPNSPFGPDYWPIVWRMLLERLESVLPEETEFEFLFFRRWIHRSSDKDRDTLTWRPLEEMRSRGIKVLDEGKHDISDYIVMAFRRVPAEVAGAIFRNMGSWALIFGGLVGAKHI